ncbi:MAG: hypothetical protein ACETWR_17680 [Anaerolineae bacterium]
MQTSEVLRRWVESNTVQPFMGATWYMLAQASCRVPCSRFEQKARALSSLKQRIVILSRSPSRGDDER